MSSGASASCRLLSRKEAKALRSWLDEIIARFADRIRPVDAEIAMRAGALLRCRTTGLPINHFHDALLVATAQRHGHGLLTGRGSSCPGRKSKLRRSRLNGYRGVGS
jgi:predicted nucleic acid-binding protein